MDRRLLKWDQQRVTGSSALIFDTGSNVLEVYGDISASANISASYFYGDGSNLTGITSVNINNDGSNRILTANGDNTLHAETNFTFDGTVLTVTGSISSSANISASYFYGDGSNLTNLPHAEQDLDSVLTAGNTSTLSMSVNSVTSSTANFTGLSAGTAARTSSFIILP